MIYTQKNKKMPTISGVILNLFPWRDGLAILVGETPFRFGEVFAGLFGIIGVFKYNNKIKKTEVGIILILAINLINAIVGVSVYKASIDIGFALKYIFRNAVYFMFVFAFLRTKFSYNKLNIWRLMSGFVILQFISFIIIEFTGIHLMYSKLWGWDLIETTGQYFRMGGIRLPRFMGTTAEAGYLAPLLIMPIYYYLSFYIKDDKNHKQRKNSLKYIIICYLMALFTFSAAVYVFVTLISFVVIINNANKKRTKLVIIFIVVLAVVFIFAVVGISPLNEIFYKEFVNKILAYAGNDKVSNWSAMDRSQHLQNAWNIFKESDILQFFIGHGTGGYYARSKMNTSLLVSNVDEAYNLFLSSLTDRGIIGFICLILIPFYIRKMKTRSIESQTLFYGIVFQYLHWMLTGNFWLYYFWYEIIIFIGIYRHDCIMHSVPASDTVSNQQSIQVSNQPEVAYIKEPPYCRRFR